MGFSFLLSQQKCTQQTGFPEVFHLSPFLTTEANCWWLSHHWVCALRLYDIYFVALVKNISIGQIHFIRHNHPAHDLPLNYYGTSEKQSQDGTAFHWMNLPLLKTHTALRNSSSNIFKERTHFRLNSNARLQIENAIQEGTFFLKTSSVNPALIFKFQGAAAFYNCHRLFSFKNAIRGPQTKCPDKMAMSRDLSFVLFLKGRNTKCFGLEARTCSKWITTIPNVCAYSAYHQS